MVIDNKILESVTIFTIIDFKLHGTETQKVAAATTKFYTVTLKIVYSECIFPGFTDCGMT